MYLKTWECKDGQIRGIAQFTTGNAGIEEGSTITSCNTDFQYDVGLECFTTEDQDFWYSCKVKLLYEYSDDETKPAIGGTSGNYHYEQYEIEEILMDGRYDAEDECFYLRPHSVLGLSEIAYIYEDWEVDFNALIKHWNKDCQLQWLRYKKDLEDYADKIKLGQERGYIIYMDGYRISSWGTERCNFYNPHTRIEYKSFINPEEYDKQMGNWAEQEILAVYINDIYTDKDTVYF